MRTFPDVRFRELNEAMANAQQLLDARQLEPAKAAFLALRDQTRKVGIASGQVSWGLAIALDQLGDADLALDHIEEALTRDPLNPAYVQSRRVITGNLRAKLERAVAADATDAHIGRMYGLLQKAADADDPSHLAMARHLAATDRTTEALAIVDAVLRLSPCDADAWRQKAAIARELGNAELAIECEAAAAASGSDASEKS